MEAIITIVGFLGVGKTTLLKRIVQSYIDKNWNPTIILNDYENANLDAQKFLSFLKPEQISALSGSCICCTGIDQLRNEVNKIPPREKGITLIEANGTTDAVSLMGFLGVGMESHFLPPVQIAVVDVRNWQQRGEHNELEANQVQVSSLVILNFASEVSFERQIMVEEQIRKINPHAKLVTWEKLDIDELPKLHANDNEATKMEHHKSHWSSCSVDLPDSMSSERLKSIIDQIPKDILRVKGCSKLDQDDSYSHFERTPSGEIYIRQFIGEPITGAKLLTIGPGSDPEKLLKIVSKN
jgi:G3E family GTPase